MKRNVSNPINVLKGNNESPLNEKQAPFSILKKSANMSSCQLYIYFFIKYIGLMENKNLLMKLMQLLWKIENKMSGKSMKVYF